MQSIPVTGNAGSITRSAIADGIIEVADKKDLEAINHDTANALNKLDAIFNLKDVKEKQALANAMAKEGFGLIGDIAVSKQKDLIAKSIAAKANKDEAKAQQYLDEAKKWSDGGEYKVALHGLLGGLVSAYGGNGFADGLTAGAVNEYMTKTLGKLPNSTLKKLASGLIGQLAGKDIGSAIAEKATEFNWLTHEEQQQMLRDFAASYTWGAEGEERRRDILAFWFALSNYRNVHGEGSSTDRDEIIDGSVKSGLDSFVPDGYKYVFDGGMNYFLNYVNVLGGWRSVDKAYSYRSAFEHGDLSSAKNQYVMMVDPPGLSKQLTAERAKTYANEGDRVVIENGLANQVYQSPTDGNSYIDYNGQTLFTTEIPRYSGSQYGEYLADVKGYPVHYSEATHIDYVEDRYGHDWYVNRVSPERPSNIVQAGVDALWGRTLGKTAEMKGAQVGVSYAGKALSKAPTYMKATGRALAKKTGGLVGTMGVYGYSVASDAATFEGYPDLQEKAKVLDDESLAVGIAAPAIGAGVGSVFAPGIGTTVGTVVGEGTSFVYDVTIELEKQELEEQRNRK